MILSGWWSKLEVIQVLGNSRFDGINTSARSGTLRATVP